MPAPQSSYSIHARGGFDARRMSVAFGQPAVQPRVAFGAPSTPGTLIPPTASPAVTDVPLASNARGPAVVALQQVLAMWGYSPGPIDGILGPKTVAAINAAWTSLARSPSDTVRANAAAPWTTYGNVGALATTLATALQTDALLTGRAPLGQPPTAAAPPQSIPMSSVDANDVQVELGLQKRAGVPTWAWWLLGGGVAVALAAVVATSKRRR